MPLAGRKRKAESLAADYPRREERGMPNHRGMAQQRGVKFVITPFRHPVVTDPGYAEKTWATLKEAIFEINRRNTSHLSYGQLYTCAYNMVLQKQGDLLYHGLETVQKDHLEQVANIVRLADGESFLSVVETQWDHYKVSLHHVKDILMYMDRTYVLSKGKRTVYDLGIGLFREMIIYDKVIAERLINTVLAKIDSERNGETIDAQLIRAITRMLAELGDDDESKYHVYCEYFEGKFLRRTAEFYARESQLFLAETSCPDYLKKAAKRIQEEETRVYRYLDERSLPKVKAVVEMELIAKYMRRLVEMENSGLIWMLRNDKVYDLKLMYSLFRFVPGGEEIIRKHLKQEVLERGLSLVVNTENVKDNVSVIDSLLRLREKYDQILNFAFVVSQPSAQTTSRTSAGGMNDSFSGSTSSGPRRAPDRKFINAVNEAFERFLHSFTRAPEYVSLYVDRLLRQDFKSKTETEIESKLQAVMTLFRYLHEKDAFERYYKLHLTKRLLYGRSISSDAETSFISKLKNECGYLYTVKMEQMFNDMKTSAETMECFRTYADNHPILPLPSSDLEVSVLTTVSWPIQSCPPCKVPRLITRMHKAFEQFYNSKHNGRKLSWQMSLGTAELKSSFGDGSRDYLLCVTAYAMCILMLFNDHDTMTTAQILERTRIPKSELIRTLQSLSLAKYRVLTKDPKRKEVEMTDRFSYNNDFRSKLHRIKIQMVSAKKESEEEKRKTRGRIDDDRKPLIEAAIVRIMKQRRILDHNSLIIEVTSLLGSRFIPDTSDIKKRIESLVEREFLEREEDQLAVYKYVA